MRIQIDSAIVTPTTPVKFSVVGQGADKASVRVLESSGFVGHTPTLKITTTERPRWELAITRLPPELYAARQRVRVVVGIFAQGAKTRPIRKELVLHLASAGGDVVEQKAGAEIELETTRRPESEVPAEPEATMLPDGEAHGETPRQD